MTSCQKLNWAKTHGHARILESSQMLVEDGKKGDLATCDQISVSFAGANGVVSPTFRTLV